MKILKFSNGYLLIFSLSIKTLFVKLFFKKVAMKRMSKSQVQIKITEKQDDISTMKLNIKSMRSQIRNMEYQIDQLTEKIEDEAKELKELQQYDKKELTFKQEPIFKLLSEFLNENLSELCLNYLINKFGWCVDCQSWYYNSSKCIKCLLIPPRKYDVGDIICQLNGQATVGEYYNILKSMNELNGKGYQIKKAYERNVDYYDLRLMVDLSKHLAPRIIEFMPLPSRVEYLFL